MRTNGERKREGQSRRRMGNGQIGRVQARCGWVGSFAGHSPIHTQPQALRRTAQCGVISLQRLQVTPFGRDNFAGDRRSQHIRLGLFKVAVNLLEVPLRVRNPGLRRDFADDDVRVLSQQQNGRWHARSYQRVRN